MRRKLVSADEAAALIHDGDTITTSGFVGIGVPDALLEGLARRRRESGGPSDLTLLFAAGQGDGGERGLNRLAAPGLLKRVIGGHWGLIPKIGALAVEGEIEAYNLPQGCISQLYRDIAAGKPGSLSRVGLGTFVDPRQDGGKINAVTTEDLVTLITPPGGDECLFYHAMPIHVALLRGSTADEAGNVTLEREALVLDNLAQAMAAKNSGGLVIVQVQRMVAKNTLNPRDVVIPGALVDAVVISAPELHLQTYATPYLHTFTGRYRAPQGESAPPPLDARKIIARRACFELPVNGVVNLGIGMPEGVAAVAEEEGLLAHVTLTAEPGVIGGRPASGLDFGAAVNTDAIIPQNAQFDFYDGGGLDLAVLGMAEADAEGNVNVSRFGKRLAGAGGFINISQNAREVVFTGQFSAGGARVAITDGRLAIEAEGAQQKFVQRVQQVTFAGGRAAQTGKTVLYVTERAVFELTPAGVRLAEIAPGLDLERDVLARMAFRPLLDRVGEMDGRIFRDEPMGLRVDLLHLDLEDRLALDREADRLFLNFEKLKVRSDDDVWRIDAAVRKLLTPHGRPVDVIANYDGARIDEDVEDAYTGMVRALEHAFYRTVTRYSGSAFMRLKLGRAFAADRPPHIFETAEEARSFLAGRSGQNP